MAPEYAALPAHLGAHLGSSSHACIQGTVLQPSLCTLIFCVSQSHRPRSIGKQSAYS